LREENATLRNNNKDLKQKVRSANRHSEADTLAALHDSAGTRYRIDHAKLIHICQASAAAAAACRKVGAPKGPVDSWRPPPQEIEDKINNNPHRRCFNMTACWACLERAEKGGEPYRPHSDSDMAKQGAGHDPRFCEFAAESYGNEPLLKDALVEAKPNSPGKGGKGYRNGNGGRGAGRR
jgi:hypothetical protein